jgi:hypothetical protein
MEISQEDETFKTFSIAMPFVPLDPRHAAEPPASSVEIANPSSGRGDERILSWPGDKPLKGDYYTRRWAKRL